MSGNNSNIQLDELREALEEIENANNNPTMDLLKLHAECLPKFNGNPDLLEGFLMEINTFYTKYHETAGTTETQKEMVLLLIKTKIIEEAQIYVQSNPQFKTWLQIRQALKDRFGDQTTVEMLQNQLNYMKIQRNESYLEFIERLSQVKYKIQRKNALNNTAAVVTLLNAQIEKQALTTLLINVKSDLCTIIRCRNVETINDAIPIIQEDLELKNQQNPSFKVPITAQRPNWQQKPSSSFPSQPIPVKPRFLPQQNFPTNQQVFGRRNENVFKPNQRQYQYRDQYPQPMSGVSVQPRNNYNPPRWQQQKRENSNVIQSQARRPNLQQNYNHFQNNQGQQPHWVAEELHTQEQPEQPSTSQNFWDEASEELN